MKTNVVLSSESRELLGVVIKQKTENGFLCLTDLQQAYEFSRAEYGWGERKINHIVSTQTFKERTYYILKELKIIDTEFTAFIQLLDNQGIVDSFKKLGIWEMKGKGADRAVWVNPYIFVGIALEMNPKLYASTVMWLTDTLIFDRKEAGGNYLPMNVEIKNLLGNDVEYWKFAVEINNRVFGKHEKGIRNFATKEQLQQISKIETQVKSVIQLGFAKSEKDIYHTIQKCEL